jgi:peptidoglycan/xylan/chitin deacetylase (PgdA/CDA1 family)
MTLIFRLTLCFLLSQAFIQTASAQSPARKTQPLEIHDQISLPSALGKLKPIALTLDACSGRFDADLISFLIRNNIPATLFVTKRWLLKNGPAIQILKTNANLFDIEDHGENHIPAVVGRGRRVYGIQGEPDILHLRREVQEGARAIEQLIGGHPHWYRGATAVYDYEAAEEIRKLGFKIAGFSVNADAGATLRKDQILARLRQVKPRDVIIAHMNKPRSDTAEALSVGLLELIRQGFTFVRLDEVDLVEISLTDK